MVESDRPRPPPDLDVSDRPYFRWHREHPGTDPYVSAPFGSRASGGAGTFFVTQRRSSPHGLEDFTGVVAAGIRQRSFAEFWERAAPAPDSSVILFRADGTVLARRPPVPDEELVLPSGAPIMRAVAEAEERRVVRGVSWQAPIRWAGLNERFLLRHPSPLSCSGMGMA